MAGPGVSPSSAHSSSARAGPPSPLIHTSSWESTVLTRLPRRLPAALSRVVASSWKGWSSVSSPRIAPGARRSWAVSTGSYTRNCERPVGSAAELPQWPQSQIHEPLITTRSPGAGMAHRGMFEASSSPSATC